MREVDGPIWAFRVDGNGQGRRISGDALAEEDDGAAYTWIHLDLNAEETRRWVREHSGLGELAADALLAEETRPRSTPMGDGLMLVLRGVNLNPGADPEDMVAVRLWADARRVITVRRRRLLALEDVRDGIESGRGPTEVGEFVAEVADRLVERMAGVLSDLDDDLDAVDSTDEEGNLTERRAALLELRRRAILLRRYLSPQRDALARLSTERIGWLSEVDRLLLREIHDRTTRYVEDLEAARERAAVTQEELASRLAEQLNQRMYALSIVAGIFLPLSFVTGLLGINVDGIPGAQTTWAFAAVCVALVVFGIFEVLLFRRLRWL